jgi:hypothetical protein
MTTLPELGGELVEHFIHQPEVDEGLATGAAIAVLQRIFNERKLTHFEYPEGWQFVRQLDIVVVAGEGYSENLVSYAAELGGHMQTWMDLYEFRCWDQPRLLVTWGGRVCRGFCRTPPSPELISRIAQAKARPLRITWTEEAKELYRKRKSLLFADKSEDAFLQVIWFIASGTESGVITPEIVATAWTIYLLGNGVAWNLLEIVGMFNRQQQGAEQ